MPKQSFKNKISELENKVSDILKSQEQQIETLGRTLKRKKWEIFWTLILGSLLTMIGSIGTWTFQSYKEKENLRNITVELLSSEIELNLYDIVGDDDFSNIQKTYNSLINSQKSGSFYAIRRPIREFYDRNSNNLVLLNVTTTISIINFYNLLKAIDEDATSMEDSLSVEGYRNLVEDTRKARVFGSQSLALLEYYYDPKRLEWNVSTSTEEAIFKKIQDFPKNATTTTEKWHENIYDQVFVKFMFLKSKKMELIDKDWGIYRRI